MRKYKNFKNEIARKNKILRVIQLKGNISTKEFFSLLSPKTQKSIENENEKKSIKFAQEIIKLRKKRIFI